MRSIRRGAALEFTAVVTSLVVANCAGPARPHARPTSPPEPRTSSSVPCDMKAPTETKCAVDHDVDGDTISVDLKGKKNLGVRLIGIDTPETKAPGKPVECYGPEASAFMKELLPRGTVVRIEFDKDRYDRYGRALAYVYKGHVFVNDELAKKGYADVLTIEPNVEHERQFKASVAAAQEAGLGRWAEC